ncbi:MAG: hypothetical protein VXA09_02345 [Burkholderiaceae bacterium]
MTARVITDPSALGWVLDPDTGRWEWSGSGDGGGSGGGGSEWELLETVEVEDSTGAPWVTQIDITGFNDEYREYDLRISDVVAVANSGNLLSTARIAMSTSESDVVGDVSSWETYCWRTDAHWYRNTATSGQYVTIFGSDANQVMGAGDALNSSFKNYTGVNDKFFPDNHTAFEWSGMCGPQYFRSHGKANRRGRIHTLSLSMPFANGTGIRRGVFKLFGLKRD